MGTQPIVVVPGRTTMKMTADGSVSGTCCGIKTNRGYDNSPGTLREGRTSDDGVTQTGMLYLYD